MSAEGCAHISAVASVNLGGRECAACVKSRSRWVHLRTCQTRRDALLRLVVQPARERARALHLASGHRLGGTVRTRLCCYPDDAYAEY